MDEQSRQWVRPDGAVIRYRLVCGAGARPVLVLIHGMASDLTRWWEFVERTDLTQSWDLLRPDLRGHGESLFRGRVGMEVWCDDLAAILRAEGYDRAVIGGHCLGANLAVFCAVRHPARTAGLILVEPMPPEAVVGSLKRVRPLKPVAAAVVRIIRAMNALGIYRRRLPRLDLKTLDVTTLEAMAQEGSPAPSTAFQDPHSRPDPPLDRPFLKRSGDHAGASLGTARRPHRRSSRPPLDPDRVRGRDEA